MDPVTCDSCGAHFPVKRLTEEEYRALRDQHYYREFTEELRMLEKVKAFYRRHPEAEGRIRPDFLRMLESDDPEIREKLCSGVSFDQIELPPEQLPLLSEVAEDEAEVVEYLRHHHFVLGSRMEFVLQRIEHLKGSVGLVTCPHCKEGRLHVTPTDWDEFTSGDAITWYWPDWHAFDSDGTLHVKASGYKGEAHWTGESEITPDKPEYAFWCWLVAQKKFHRLVEEGELPAIREEWSRLEPGGSSL